MNKSIEILLILIAITIILFTINCCNYFKKEQSLNINIKRTDFKSLVIGIIIAVVLGVSIQKIDLEKVINALNEYYNSIMYIFIGILFILIFEIYFYKNSKLKIISKYLEILTYIVFSYILTLFATNKVNIMNLTCSLTWLTIFYTYKLYEDTVEGNNVTIDEKNNEPIRDKSQLYPQRLTELEHIERYIYENVRNSGCTISICSNWGEGKTSFINVMKQDMNNGKDYVIFIQPMIMDSRESLVEYFFSQIKSIMEKQSIYTGKGSSINKYLKSIMEIISKDSKGIFDSVFSSNSSEKKDYRYLKEDLQKDIDTLLNFNSVDKRNIIIFIDDFDRVEESVMYQVLTFIKEIASFRGCVVIFLMDYRNIKDDKITYKYLDKFVSKKFELKKINKKEIMNYYISKNIYFDGNSVEEELIKDQYSYFKKYIGIHLDKIENILENTKKEVLEEINTKKETNGKSTDELNKYLNRLEKYIKEYIDLCSNPRKLKKLFKEIEDICKFIYKKYSNDDIEQIREYYKLLDCNEIIVKIAIIKVFFEEEFDDLMDSLDIEEYIRIKKSKNIITSLFNIDRKEYLNERKLKIQEEKYKFINENFIISCRYAESKTEIKTSIEELLYELDNDKIEKSEKYYEIVDIVKAIYSGDDKSDFKITKDRLYKLYNYIIYIIDNKKHNFNEVVDIILQNKCRTYYNNNLKNIEYILEIILCELFNREYTYNLIKEQEQNLYSIKDFKSNIAFKNRSLLSIILECAVIESDENDCDTIYRKIKNLDQIEDINAFAVDILCITDIEIDTEESRILKTWVEESKNKLENNKSIDKSYKDGLKYAYEKAENFINVIKLLETIEFKISEAKVTPKYEVSDMLTIKSLDELQKEIRLFESKVFEIDEKTDMYKIYSFFDEILVYTYKFIQDQNEIIEEDCLEKLESIYKKLNEEYKKEYLEPLLWSDCSLNMIYIKKYYKNKQINNS